jgi:membrane-associated protease RseP (regulator of RpoE activity)
LAVVAVLAASSVAAAADEPKAGESDGPDAAVRVRAVRVDQEADPVKAGEAVVQIQRIQAKPKIVRAGERAVQYQIGTAASADASHWLGLVCVTIDPAVRAQVDLPKNQGVMINSVMRGTPAEKAGLKQYDILVTVDGEPLEKLSNLLEAVKESEGKGISVEYLRSGKKRTVTVTPAKRPSAQYILRLAPQTDVKVVHDVVKQLQKKNSPARIQLGTVGPQFVYPPLRRPKAPDDLRLSITKQGNQPGKIRVELGDESWEVNANETHKLPEKVRKYVPRLPGAIAVGVANADDKTVRYYTTIRSLADGKGHYYVSRFAKAGDVVKRLDQIEKQLKEALDEIRALRAEQSGERPEVEKKR